MNNSDMAQYEAVRPRVLDPKGIQRTGVAMKIILISVALFLGPVFFLMPTNKSFANNESGVVDCLNVLFSQCINNIAETHAARIIINKNRDNMPTNITIREDGVVPSIKALLANMNVENYCIYFDSKTKIAKVSIIGEETGVVPPLDRAKAREIQGLPPADRLEGVARGKEPPFLTPQQLEKAISDFQAKGPDLEAPAFPPGSDSNMTMRQLQYMTARGESLQIDPDALMLPPNVPKEENITNRKFQETIKNFTANHSRDEIVKLPDGSFLAIKMNSGQQVSHDFSVSSQPPTLPPSSIEKP